MLQVQPPLPVLVEAPSVSCPLGEGEPSKTTQDASYGFVLPRSHCHWQKLAECCDGAVALRQTARHNCTRTSAAHVSRLHRCKSLLFLLPENAVLTLSGRSFGDGVECHFMEESRATSIFPPSYRVIFLQLEHSVVPRHDAAAVRRRYACYLIDKSDFRPEKRLLAAKESPIVLEIFCSAAFQPFLPIVWKTRVSRGW